MFFIKKTKKNLCIKYIIKFIIIIIIYHSYLHYLSLAKKIIIVEIKR